MSSGPRHARPKDMLRVFVVKNRAAPAMDTRVKPAHDYERMTGGDCPQALAPFRRFTLPWKEAPWSMVRVR